MTEEEVIQRFTFPRCRLFRLRCWLHLRHSTGGRQSEFSCRQGFGLKNRNTKGEFKEP